MIFSGWEKKSRWRRAAGRRRMPRTLFVELLEERAVPSFLPTVDYPAGSSPDVPRLGDFHHKGILDLAVTNAGSNTVSVFPGNGDGTFGKPTTLDTDRAPNDLVVADLTGNGNLDLVTANFNGNTVSVFLGNGDGTFQKGMSFPAGNGSDGLAVGDFYGDGILNLVTVNARARTASFLRGNG
ncbi:MAG TPA: VCBS repeat-containing protein, partial [Gemmataceae bacterium]|nr:VCBS repeat-containing protein [Gemmataceae bacterium]